MTHAIDSFLVKIGFDARDLRGITHRPALYFSIISLLFLAVTFFILAIKAWVF